MVEVQIIKEAIKNIISHTVSKCVYQEQEQISEENI
jgi:hypothetical protein